MDEHRGHPIEKCYGRWVYSDTRVPVERQKNRVTHLMHACQIIGYKHPDLTIAQCFEDCYNEFCRKTHVFPESEGALDNRLNAEESVFKSQQ
jgi:hypothetical protein